MGYGALMLRPRGGRAPIPPPALRIERVTDEAGLRDFQTAITRGFGTDEVPQDWTVFAPGVLGDPREHLWVGYEEDRAVCAASAFVAEGIVDVTLVATVPEARRRGYGTAVTWKATMADPDLHALLIATPEGKPAYEAMGYLPLFNFTTWTKDRPAKESA
jgi:GNAT superfamily N-acetyltransferase